MTTCQILLNSGNKICRNCESLITIHDIIDAEDTKYHGIHIRDSVVVAELVRQHELIIKKECCHENEIRESRTHRGYAVQA